MSIAHELSCDVAAAMLSERADERQDAANADLTDIVLEVHTTLRRLTNDARRRRTPRAPPPPADTKTHRSQPTERNPTPTTGADERVRASRRRGRVRLL